MWIKRQHACINGATEVISDSNYKEEEAQSGTGQLVNVGTRMWKSESSTVSLLHVPRVVPIWLQCTSTSHPVVTCIVKSKTPLTALCTRDRDDSKQSRVLSKLLLLCCHVSVHVSVLCVQQHYFQGTSGQSGLVRFLRLQVHVLSVYHIQGNIVLYLSELLMLYSLPCTCDIQTLI